MNKKYYIITFGCQMNKNDSEHLAGMLEFEGAHVTENIEEANIVVLNTCAVREKAERRVYGQLDKLNHLRKVKKLDMKLYLAGCMPAYNKGALQKKIKYLDGFIDLEEARRYPAKRQDGNQAWVSIMYGCNNFCSYCIVPYVRGREKSRPVSEILAEIKKIDFSKHDYLCLLGQNVNSYTAKGIDFPALLEKIIIEIPDIPKVGFLTSHPKDMSDKLITILAKYPKIDRELHLPLQHGNNRILKLMNRGYTYEHYVALVKKIRASVPEVKISTDLIAGFPGETTEEFNDTLKAVAALAFYRINTAAYSPRPGTKAAKLSDQLTEEIKNKRLNKLNGQVKKDALINW